MHFAGEASNPPSLMRRKGTSRMEANLEARG